MLIMVTTLLAVFAGMASADPEPAPIFKKLKKLFKKGGKGYKKGGYRPRPVYRPQPVYHKPVYHPPPVYHQPQPVYRPQPVYHAPRPVHYGGGFKKGGKKKFG